MTSRLVLTFGAAVATLVIVLGVITGPALVSCYGAGGELGTCLRTALADSNLLPELERPDPAAASASGAGDRLEIIAQPAAETGATPERVTDPAAAPAAPAPPVETAVAPGPSPNAPAAEPAVSGPPAREATVAATEEAPGAAELFVSLVRVEPSGDMLVAGSAKPGEIVEVWANDELLGTTVAERSGDWVLVPDAPLGVGGAELTVRTAGAVEPTGQSFAIIVEADRSSEPLVVASAPGQASRILQGFVRSSIPAREVDAVSGNEPPVATAPEVTDSDVAGEVTDTAALDVAPATPGADVLAPLAPPASSGARALARPPTIDAIEIDGDGNFFAGSGTEGATIRLYVDNEFVADAVVAEGRWLVEATGVLARDTQRVRADLLRPGSSEVVARAEVNFVVSVPLETAEPAADTDPGTATVVASVAAEESVSVIADELSPAHAASPVEGPVVVGEEVSDPPPATPEAPETQVAASDTTTATPPAQVAEVPAQLPATEPAANAEPAATPVSPDVRVAVAPEPSAPPPAAPTVRSTAPVAALPHREPFPESEALANLQTTTAAATAPPGATTAGGGAVGPVLGLDPAGRTESRNVTAVAAPSDAGRVFNPPDPDIPTMVATPRGDAEVVRFAAGRAIIRRGDNLWTIAKRVYGSGLKYTTIFEANEDQIRSPDRIYPGQVFQLPATPR